MPERRQKNEKEKFDNGSFGNGFHAVIYLAFGLGREPSAASMGGGCHRRGCGGSGWCTDQCSYSPLSGAESGLQIPLSATLWILSPTGASSKILEGPEKMASPSL